MRQGVSREMACRRLPAPRAVDCYNEWKAQVLTNSALVLNRTYGTKVRSDFEDKNPSL